MEFYEEVKPHAIKAALRSLTDKPWMFSQVLLKVPADWTSILRHHALNEWEKTLQKEAWRYNIVKYNCEGYVQEEFLLALRLYALDAWKKWLQNNPQMLNNPHHVQKIQEALGSDAEYVINGVNPINPVNPVKTAMVIKTAGSMTASTDNMLPSLMTLQFQVNATIRKVMWSVIVDYIVDILDADTVYLNPKNFGKNLPLSRSDYLKEKIIYQNPHLPNDNLGCCVRMVFDELPVTEIRLQFNDHEHGISDETRFVCSSSLRNIIANGILTVARRSSIVIANNTTGNELPIQKITAALAADMPNWRCNIFVSSLNHNLMNVFSVLKDKISHDHVITQDDAILVKRKINEDYENLSNSIDWSDDSVNEAWHGKEVNKTASESTLKKGNWYQKRSQNQEIGSI
jgi:hypothetical protein